MELTAENVKELFKHCLFDPAGTSNVCIRVEGFHIRTGMAGELINQHHDTIIELLNQLPDDFRQAEGGSYLNACINKDGQQWGEHIHVDMLLCLGRAIEKIDYTFPRSMWPKLPGGVPHFSIVE